MRDSFDKAFKITIGLEGKPSNDPEIIERLLWTRLRDESHKLCKVPTEKQIHGKKICCVNNCERPVFNSVNYCNAHYIRQKKGKDLSVPIRNRKTSADVCVVCGDKVGKRGGLSRCQKHFKSYRTQIIKEELVRIMGGCCAKCGREYQSFVYDFHHNTKNKEFGIGNLMNVASLKRIAQEVSKCILLCANCHREVHYEK
jgi:hypothetical protein